MSINCHAEMFGFHKDKVTLPKDEQDEMRKRRDAGRTRLESGLKEAKHPQPQMTVSQGSYQMRTMVQDQAFDYDIDDGAYFKKSDLTDNTGTALSATATRERICNALKWDGRLKHEAKVLNNCVRQEYPEGYHIDIPVYRVVVTKDSAGNEFEQFELASGNDWKISDARAVTRWFNGLVGELNTGEPDGSQMRRITKLTKFFSRQSAAWKKDTTSGICITKLVTENLSSVAERDDESLRETWKSMKAGLDKSTQIKHPVLDGVNLAENFDPKVTFFRDCLTGALKTLEILDSANCTQKQAREAWDKVFSTSYFSNFKDDDGGGGKKNDGGGPGPQTVAITSTSTARRNDGGGRFG